MVPPIVSTASGKLKGKLVKLKCKDAKPVNVFRNIPFAKSPLGNLRFMPPEPAEPWSGVKDATTPGNLPMYSTLYDEMVAKYFPFPDQFDSKQVLDEDCLHVSVYTPNLERGVKLPVMVYFYGGGFSSGSERPYESSALAGMNDVVVVVPNYRLNVFGFLSLGPSSICPGNVGLMDQQLALKWVQENIGSFGGDKDNVTLFGQSAGSVAVEMQMMSPLGRGLFHKGISQSGQCNMKGVFRETEQVIKCAKKLLEFFKIEETDERKIIEALQKLPADDLVKATEQVWQQNVYFQPYIDGIVLPKSPEEMSEDAKKAEIPYILSCTNTEGYGLLSCLISPNFETGMSEEELRKSPFFFITDEGMEKCIQHYDREGDKDPLRFSRLHGDMVGDSMYTSKLHQAASNYAGGKAPVYVYQAAFQLQMFHDDKYGAEVGKKPNWCLCDHGDDIFIALGWPFSPHALSCGAKFTEKEEELSRKFMTYLTNFARTGDPNKGRAVDVKWPKYKPSGQHLVVDTEFSIGEKLGEKDAEFWNVDMLPHLKDRDVE